MAFTVEEFRDLLRLLEQRPEWRADLRRAVLSDELLELPELVRSLAEAQRRTELQVEALAEAQRRTEQRLDRVEEQLAALAEAQRRTEQRLDRVEEQLAALAEAQRRTELQIEALAEAQRRTELQVEALAEAQRHTEQRLDRVEEQLAALAEAQRHMTVDLGDLKGDSLERRYRERGAAYVARRVRRARVLRVEQLIALLDEAVERGQLLFDEAEDVALADVVIHGRRRGDDAEVYLVLEVSWLVDADDVERAARRAALLQRTGVTAVPVVAGKAIRPEAVERASQLQVWQLTDGRPQD